MRHLLQGVTLGIIAVVVIVIIMAITGRNSTEKEAQETLSTTITETLDNMSISGAYTIKDPEKFKADFVELFIDQMNLDDVTVQEDDGVVSLKDDDMALQINFAVADTDEEIMMVHVIEQISYPNGSDGIIEDTAAIVFTEEQEMNEYSVTYRIEQEDIESHSIVSPVVYHHYDQEEGQKMEAPANPKDEDGRTITIKWICVSAPNDGKPHNIKTYAETHKEYTAAELSAIEIDGDYVFQAVIK